MCSARSLAAVCLIVLLVFSFAVVVEKSIVAAKSGLPIDLLTCSSGLSFWGFSNYHITLAERGFLSDNTTRMSIFSFIGSNPGVQFRAICSGLGLSVGVVQFHLGVLEKKCVITSLCVGKYKRFFVSGKFSYKEMETIAALKLGTVKSMLKMILEDRCISHHELATKICITSQGLTWQINRIRQSGLIVEYRNGLSVSYSINDCYVALLTRALSFV